jgi:hypothetical protein
MPKKSDIAAENNFSVPAIHRWPHKKKPRRLSGLAGSFYIGRLNPSGWADEPVWIPAVSAGL